MCIRLHCHMPCVCAVDGVSGSSYVGNSEFREVEKRKEKNRSWFAIIFKIDKATQATIVLL